MTIQALTKDHLPAVAQLESLCFSSPWSLTQLEETLAQPHSHFYIALIDDTLAGYVSFSTILEDGYINNVAVHPELRQQGIAHHLLTHIWTLFQDSLDFLTLEVRESNLPAVKLYEKCGYTSVGLRKNYYDNPKEHAVLMTKFNPKKGVPQ